MPKFHFDFEVEYPVLARDFFRKFCHLPPDSVHTAADASRARFSNTAATANRKRIHAIRGSHSVFNRPRHRARISARAPISETPASARNVVTEVM